MEDKLKALQGTLIKKFMLIMVFVCILEYAVFSLLNRAVFPFILDVFFEDSDIRSLSFIGIFMLIITMVGSLFLQLLKAVLPDRPATYFGQLLTILWERYNRGSSGPGIQIQQMGTLKEFIFFLLLLIIAVLTVMPLIAGGLLFVRMVIKQFRIIEAAEKEKQREYERKRNLMLSDIAHDLRTPMTTVYGYSKALSDGMVPEDRKQEYLDSIMSKSSRMNELIGFLFDYVKTDSEGFSLNREKTDICELVRECVALSYQDMEDAGMEPDVMIPDERIEVSVDKLHFSRTVTNLITNAIRHNEDGTRIGAVVEKEDKKIRVFIADSGERIPDEVAEHLFEPFVMSDKSRSSKGGSGLGLSIAKKIIELHGFKLSLIQDRKVKDYPVLDGYSKAFMIVGEAAK